ncbi:unnamed protein product [Scytosiphon promiscuus]
MNSSFAKASVWQRVGCKCSLRCDEVLRFHEIAAVGRARINEPNERSCRRVESPGLPCVYEERAKVHLLPSPGSRHKLLRTSQSGATCFYPSKPTRRLACPCPVFFPTTLCVERIAIASVIVAIGCTEQVDNDEAGSLFCGFKGARALGLGERTDCSTRSRCGAVDVGLKVAHSDNAASSRKRL